MKYCLVIYKPTEMPFEITNYANILNEENMDETSLADIIKFTNSFSSEEYLTETLLYYGLIPKNYKDGSFCIYYYKSKYDKPKKLSYGVSFSQDAKYFNIEFLKYYYTSKLKCMDFMEAFIQRYYAYLKDRKVYSGLLNALRYAYETYAYGHYLTNEENAYYEECILKFITYYTRRKDSKGEYKESIASIRDLAMFAINYERTNGMSVPTNKFKDPNYLQSLHLQLHHLETLIKEDGITSEEYDSYIQKIDYILNEIALVSDNDYTRERICNDGTTTN